MNWYLSRRLMACRVADRPADIEEDFFVVRADSLREAKKEARRLSKAEERSYANVYGQEVVWRFQDLIETTELEVRQFNDGDCIYRRAFPRVSRIAERSRERLRIRGSVGQGSAPGWYGAMLLFRTCGRPAREEERLIVLLASSWSDAERRALLLGKRAADTRREELVGLFQVHEISDAEFISGLELYSRFFRPSDLKRSNQPPRESNLTTADFQLGQARVRASA